MPLPLKTLLLLAALTAAGCAHGKPLTLRESLDAAADGTVTGYRHAHYFLSETLPSAETKTKVTTTLDHAGTSVRKSRPATAIRNFFREHVSPDRKRGCRPAP